ncbi:hypothetical protein [Nocardioides sp. InS609-2]|uniref:hypothetical protein n=1 Tax=Nocardioides sp. InS609-2 TaxID=2760705 RepID=UPI0020BFA5C5|nr:hypothetical protein [Nocardioides sp. InS609-2]
MRGAVVGVVSVAALACGAVAGVLLSMAQAEPADDVAAPVPAMSPSLPVDPAPLARPDADTPALQPGLTYVDDMIGANGFEVKLRSPEGWTKVIIGAAEAKWVVQGNRLNTFLLRVESVESQRQSVERIKSERIEDLRRLTKNFRLVQETETSIQIIYVDDNGLTKYGNVRWIDDPDPDSDQAVVEIAANGRERDQPGLLDLITRVGNSVEARL